MSRPASSFVSEQQERRERQERRHHLAALMPTKQLAPRRPRVMTDPDPVIKFYPRPFQVKRRPLKIPTPRSTLLFYAPYNRQPAAKIFQGNWFPSILDDILTLLPPSELPTLRLVCKTVQKRIDQLTLKEIRLTPSERGNPFLQAVTVLGAKLPLPSPDPVRSLNHPQNASFVRVLHTQSFYAPDPSSLPLRPPPNLCVLHCHERSAVYPAQMAVQYSNIYPFTVDDLLGRLIPGINVGIDKVQINHLVWELQYELDDDVIYARLPDKFAVPSSLRRLTIKLRRFVPSNPVKRPLGYWDWLGFPQPTLQIVYDEPTDPPPGAVFRTRQDLFGPNDEEENEEQWTFFARLAKVVAGILDRVEVCIVGADEWPDNWIDSYSLGDGYTFQEKFELRVVHHLEELYGDANDGRWDGPIPNLTFAEVDEVEEETLAAALPPAWR